MESSIRQQGSSPTQIIDSVAGTDTELQTLRKLLLGADYQQLLRLKQELENPNLFSLSLSRVISEALAIRAQQDASIGQALGPTIEGAIDHSIKSNPKALADSLYPVMGPAIRKSIFETINGMLEGFNQAVEQSLSPRSIGWRIDAWRTGKSYSEIVFLKTLVYRVEQVFLIHKNTGLVLQHLQSNDVVSRDPELVSAMLTAIQDFITDSFETTGSELSTLQLGDLQILIEQGPSAVIAAAVRGNVTPKYRRRLSETLESCHEQYAQEFDDYQGDNSLFVKLPQLLQPCLSSLKHEEVDEVPVTKRKPIPWIAWLTVAAVFSGWLYFWYQSSLLQSSWLQWVETVDQTPGLVVTESGFDGDRGYIKGLKDPLAQLPAADNSEITFADINYQWRPFVSSDDSIQLQRLTKLLSPPDQLNLSLSETRLNLQGIADVDWYESLLDAPLSLVGVTDVAAQSLSLEESNQRDIEHYLSDLATVSLHFDVGEARFDDADIPKLFYLATRSRQVQQQLIPERQTFFLRITGSTDALGTNEENRKLGLARAANVAEYLSSQGVDVSNLSTDFHLADERNSDSQARRISIEAWVENPLLDEMNRALAEGELPRPTEVAL